MAWNPKRLQEISEEVENSCEPKATVRELLSWFGMYRRSWRNVARIRSALKKQNLVTKPDFEYVWIDGTIRFVRPEPIQAPEPVKATTEEAAPARPVLGIDEDPAYRIGKLDPANNVPVAIAPDKPLTEAVTLLLQNDFSQLPVMTNERDVKGIISWKTIGARLALGGTCSVVRDCMETAHVISSEVSIFDAATSLVDDDYVLIRGEDRRISGIVTASDMAEQFGKLGEPFLVLGEIENHLRMLLDGKFTLEELRAARNPGDEEREVENIADLTFGEYVRLLQNPDMWSKVGLKLDRAVFVEKVEKIRLIRNDVMHFDPDGIADDDLEVLRSFTKFAQTLRRIMPSSKEE